MIRLWVLVIHARTMKNIFRVFFSMFYILILLTGPGTPQDIECSNKSSQEGHVTWKPPNSVFHKFFLCYRSDGGNFFFFFFLVFLPFLRPLLGHMEVPQAGVESEL